MKKKQKNKQNKNPAKAGFFLLGYQAKVTSLVDNLFQ
jgi:hypothetical protein